MTSQTNTVPCGEAGATLPEPRLEHARLARMARRFYPNHILPSHRFEVVVDQTVRPGDRVLDAGCGRGKFFPLAFARSLGCTTAGVDASPAVSKHRGLDWRIRSALERLPFADASFDVVICRLVVEHLVEPAVVLREFHRILSPRGGRLLIFTPNLMHYFGLAARLTPHWFHTWFNRTVRGFEEEDTFPTCYRANTRRTLRRLLLRCGFRQVRVELHEGRPDALGFFLPFYGLGVVYGRVVQRFSWLEAFRTNLIALAVKA